MPDTRRTKVRTGHDRGYTPPAGPSISRFKDRMAHRSRYVFMFLLVLITIGSVAFFAGGPFGGGPSAPAQGAGTDVVAHVNGDPITRAQLTNAVEQMSQFRQMYGMGPVSVAEQPQVFATSIGQLVNQRVELQTAHKSGIKVSDADYQKQLDQMITQQVQQEEQSYQSPAVFQQYLKDNGKTLADVQAQARDDLYNRFQDQGIDLHDALMDQILVQQFRDQKEHQLTLPRLVEYSQITMSTTPKTDATVKAQAATVVAQLKSGADFSKLAKQYSTDTTTKSKGGAMGWASLSGGFLPDTLKAAVKAKVGDILGPFKSAAGYQIIKVTGFTTRLPSGVREVAGQTPPAEDSAIIGAADAAYQTYLQGLAGKANVVYDDIAVAGAVAQSKVDNKTALADYQKALQNRSEPVDEKAWVAYAVAQMLLSQNPGKTPPAVLHQALSDFQASAAAKPSSDAWIGVGDVQLKLNNKSQAKAAYEHAMGLASGNPLTLSQLADKFHQLGAASDMDTVTKLLRSSSSPGMGGPMSIGGPGQNIPIRMSSAPAPASGTHHPVSPARH
ncbi:MAG: peptidylprolyl isomerase [Chloroflexi bacterium]|nr:peptidylprolyl isomerase [Chloroflexota bacterium]